MENNKVAEFELSTAIDVQTTVLPRRQIIQNACSWQYRTGACTYDIPATGQPRVGPWFDVFNNSLTTEADRVRDQCSKQLLGCTLRFGTVNPIPFGGFQEQ